MDTLPNTKPTRSEHLMQTNLAQNVDAKI